MYVLRKKNDRKGRDEEIKKREKLEKTKNIENKIEKQENIEKTR